MMRLLKVTHFKKKSLSASLYFVNRRFELEHITLFLQFNDLLLKFYFAKWTYSETRLKRTAWDCPNLFLKSWVHSSRESKRLKQIEPKQ
jgi:hypothetical protein